MKIKGFIGLIEVTLCYLLAVMICALIAFGFQVFAGKQFPAKTFAIGAAISYFAILAMIPLAKIVSWVTDAIIDDKKV